MKVIVQDLKSHLNEDFHALKYGYFLLFITACIYYNYQVDFETEVLNRHYGSPSCYLYYFAFYSFSYFAIAIPILFFSIKRPILCNASFWVKSILLLGIITFDGAFNFHRDIVINLNFDRLEKHFLIVIFNNCHSIISVIIPLLIIKVIFDWKMKSFYGLTFKKFDHKPYLTMLLIMLPLIIWASFQKDFLQTYPTYQPWRSTEVFGLSHHLMGLIYELVYLADFVSVELIFRGALIIGMIKLIGKDAILPMVATYAFLHFGKPMGETIGSIFGGYILGVIALRTGSILGGCIIHIGVAFLMDFLAYIQHSS